MKLRAQISDSQIVVKCSNLWLEIHCTKQNKKLFYYELVVVVNFYCYLISSYLDPLAFTGDDIRRI